MAEIAAVLGVPHTPLLWGSLTDPPDADLERVAENFARCRDVLARARPDVLVVVSSDHLRQLFTYNMPAFLVGKAPTMLGTHPSEERTFGMPRRELQGHPSFASHLIGRNELPADFDFSFSDEPWLDHSFMIPLLYLTPELEVPVVPISTNTVAPPMPRVERFVGLGSYLRSAIESWDDSKRVVVIGSGHLALDIGGPRHFVRESIDPEFDGAAVGWMADGDVAGALETCTFDRLLRAGNVAHQFLNFVTCLAAADGLPASFADATACRFGDQPFFVWEES